MVIALLLILGVELIVIVALVALIVVHQRWVLGRPGAFRGVIRVAGGDVDGLQPTWNRGTGRWVSDVLVWTKGPLLLRSELLPTAGLDERPARNDEIKRLGQHPRVIRLKSGRATLDVAAAGDHRDLLLGPYRLTREAQKE